MAEYTREQWAALSEDERGPCVLTTNSTDLCGYGKCTVIRFGRKIYRTHIVAWIDAHDQLPPPETPQILHHCDIPPCVNPDHLFAGNPKINMQDKLAKGRDHNQRKDRCPDGHAYDEENTYVLNGRRYCRACNRAKQRQWAEKNRQRLREYSRQYHIDHREAILARKRKKVS